jgi:hypothetical protein
MYRLLKQWKGIGKKDFYLEDLYVLLDVPDTNRSRNYFNTRVLSQIKRELPKYFIGMKVKPILDKQYRGRGRKPVIGYTFTWQRQESEEWIEGKYEIKEENRQAEKESGGGSYIHTFPDGSKKLMKREIVPEWIKETEENGKEKSQDTSKPKTLGEAAKELGIDMNDDGSAALGNLIAAVNSLREV